MVVPFTDTLTPTKGNPSEDTVPFTCVLCAHTLCEEMDIKVRNMKILNKYFFNINFALYLNYLKLQRQK